MPRGSGRRPLPSNVKKLRGNPGKRKLNDAEPQPPAGEPDMPAGLCKIAAAEWKAIVPELAQLGVLTKIDGKALAAYCHAFARWMAAQEEVDRLGLVLDEPIMGGPPEDREVVGYKHKRNPAVSIEHEALKIMKSFLVEFGMTPSSRSRIRIEKADQPEDPLEALLHRHGAQAQSTQVC